MIFASKWFQQLSKSAWNTIFHCPDHFFEYRNRFPACLGQKKVYKLDFEIFAIFRHSDTISSIWNLMIFHQNKWKNRIWALEKSRKLILTFCKLEMVRNVLLRILSTHTPKSAQYWLRKLDFSIFAQVGVWWYWELDFGGQNFKSGKQGRYLQKSWKTRFRDNTSKTYRKSRGTTSDPQKNVSRSVRGRTIDFTEPRYFFYR